MQGSYLPIHPCYGRVSYPHPDFVPCGRLPLHRELDPVFSGTLTRHGMPRWLLDPLSIPSIFELSSGEVGLVEYVWFDFVVGLFAHRC